MICRPRDAAFHADPGAREGGETRGAAEEGGVADAGMGFTRGPRYIRDEVEGNARARGWTPAYEIYSFYEANGTTEVVVGFTRSGLPPERR